MILRTVCSFLLIFALVFPLVAASKQVDDNVLYDSVKRKLANDQLGRAASHAVAPHGSEQDGD